MVEITAFRLESKLPPMRALEFIWDHVTFKLPYDFSYHMKTPHIISETIFKNMYRIVCHPEKKVSIQPENIGFILVNNPFMG